MGDESQELCTDQFKTCIWPSPLPGEAWIWQTAIYLGWGIWPQHHRGDEFDLVPQFYVSCHIAHKSNIKTSTVPPPAIIIIVIIILKCDRHRVSVCSIAKILETISAQIISDFWRRSGPEVVHLTTEFSLTWGIWMGSWPWGGGFDHKWTGKFKFPSCLRAIYSFVEQGNMVVRNGKIFCSWAKIRYIHEGRVYWPYCMSCIWFLVAFLWPQWFWLLEKPVAWLLTE